ncbi:hypothetical protein A1O1_02334 [Capronia coronata CBS 617.96]|uniref:MARVEL domain-containing protein n=1 Tax=Capronia coronata CBS 617.96 TaxID=1182541 RepID=W9YXE9_9EURO|nr:uncharacterized protein A1O1_02334 [Capronia coronata CBS 617.96]EXJ93941.1 hypothetical protein A1O1_02334 [Capronia coronata CBS 617.96]
MFLNQVLVLRLLQGILAFIAMALGATVANALNTHHPALAVPSSLVFFIFTAVFTMLVTVPYTIVAPRYFPVLAHPFAMLAAESSTALFWLSGFAAIADIMSKPTICAIGACPSAKGCIVVGVFEFILFATTAFFAFSHVFLGGRFAAGNNGPKKHQQQQQPQVHRAWAGAEVV